MKDNTKIVSETKSSKNKNNKKTPEKVKLKVYLMAIRRSMKEYWSFDKWNMISQFLAQTVLVVGSFASVYVASRVLGEIINSAQQGAWSSQIIPYLALQLIFYSLHRNLFFCLLFLFLASFLHPVFQLILYFLLSCYYIKTLLE